MLVGLLVGLLQRLRFCRAAHPGVAATQWQANECMLSSTLNDLKMPFLPLFHISTLYETEVSNTIIQMIVNCMILFEHITSTSTFN